MAGYLTPSLTVFERWMLACGAVATAGGFAAGLVLGWWWVTLPSLAFFSAFNGSLLVRSLLARYVKGIVMAVWGMVLVTLGGMVTVWGSWWAVWGLIGAAMAGAVVLLLQDRRDMRELRDLRERIRRAVGQM